MVARLKASFEQRLAAMMKLNPGRIDFAEKLQQMIDRYNSGAENIEQFFAQLEKLAASLDEEERRAVREELSEEELAIFGLLTPGSLSVDMMTPRGSALVSGVSLGGGPSRGRAIVRPSTSS